jgi:hypothetical protein
MTYSWTLNNTLGALSLDTGPNAMFTAGSSAGVVALAVNVTLGGRSVHNKAVITIYKGPGPAPFESFATGFWESWTGTCNPDTVNDSFQFYGSATGGKSPYTFSWNFSDGSPLSTLQNPIHAFRSSSGPSDINVNLTVLDNLGSRTTAYLGAMEPNPKCPPPGTTPPTISAFTVSPNPATSGYTAYFNVTATGGTPPYSYAYTGLPAGCSTANESFLPCIASTAGTFTVRVFVNDSARQSANSTVVLKVNVSTVSLTTVVVSPVSSTLAIGGAQVFTATSICSATCPAGITYSWNLSNNLGSLSTPNGASTRFTAGSTPGSVTLLMRASLGGKVVSDSVKVTISPSQSNPIVPSWLILLVIAIVVGMVLALLVATRRRKPFPQEGGRENDVPLSGGLADSFEQRNGSAGGPRGPQLDGEDSEPDPLADMA